MSLDVNKKIIRCDAHGCNVTTEVPIQLRQFFDNDVFELRSASSASGWVFMSSSKQDKHFCPACARKYISPKK